MSYQVKKNSPIEERLDNVIQTFIEAGLTKSLLVYAKHLFELSSSIANRNSTEVLVKQRIGLFTITHISSILSVYFAVLCIAVLVFIGEIVYVKKSEIINKYLKWFRKCVHSS